MNGKIGAFLNKKVFGVKYLYLLGVFALVLALYAFKMKDTASETEDVETAGDAPSTDSLTGEDSPGITSGTAEDLVNYPSTTGGTVVVAPATPAGDTANTAIPDNVTWTTKGTAFLVAKGISPTAAQRALSAYLTGGQISTVERKYVDMVIAEYGVPPYADNVSQSVGDKKLVRYVRKAGNDAVFAQYDDRTLWYISSTEYGRLGKPKFTDVPASDAIWQFPRYNSATGARMG